MPIRFTLQAQFDFDPQLEYFWRGGGLERIGRFLVTDLCFRDLERPRWSMAGI